MSELTALDKVFDKLLQNATPVDPLEGMNGVEVLWYLLTNWEAGRGLWFIIGFAVLAFLLSLWCDKHFDDKDIPIDYWGQDRWR